MKYPFGYTEREWAFLDLVATWSGYFVPRQFDAYVGRLPGAVTQALVQRLLKQKHATVTTHAHNAHLYHLSARPLYAALGQEDNRHRRTRPAQQVRVKLMALDFVLARRETFFLSKEGDKVERLHQLGVPHELLPQRRYRAKSGTTTTRYFLDKFPVFSNAERWCFTYISGDTSSRAPFLTYLEEHWQLFAALGSLLLLFVTSRPELVTAAEAALRAYAQKRRGSSDSATLLEFFALRRRHEGRLSELSMTELRALRAGLQTYGTPRYEALYQTWCAGDSLPFGNSEAGPQIGFEAAVLPHSYNLFGDV